SRRHGRRVPLQGPRHARAHRAEEAASAGRSEGHGRRGDVVVPERESAARAEESWWFQQEARPVAALDHPAIVRARDFGTLHDGSPYLVMDALPGRSVHEWMHTSTIPWSCIWASVTQ